MIRKEGYKSINIRHVAKCCHISVGSVYNYFESKTDLIAETVASVWCDIFHFPDYRNTKSDDPDESEIFQSFPDCVAWIFDRLKQGEEKYPGFFRFIRWGLSKKKKRTFRKEWIALGFISGKVLSLF
uniref:TetR/AcrR family transcriptional regulator n=1 Tax=Mediterraneibacter glycyrrhizinilyticus TaxID=342942 RepID=UPI001FA7DD2E